MKPILNLENKGGINTVKIGKKIVGKIYVDKGIFKKNVSIKKGHLFIKWNAWGIDKELLETLANADFSIEITEKDEGITYEVSAIYMLTNGKQDEFGDHRKQVFLPIKQFKLKPTKKNKTHKLKESPKKSLIQPKLKI